MGIIEFVVFVQMKEFFFFFFFRLDRIGSRLPITTKHCQPVSEYMSLQKVRKSGNP